MAKPSSSGDEAPVDRGPVSPPVLPAMPTTPTRVTRSPVVLPTKFEETLLILTKDGETEELDTLLVFDETSLVIQDEDSNVLRTLPYNTIREATYSRTQRRVMFVRTTRHRLTLGVGGEQVVLQLPGNTTESILSQIEQRTGVTIVRRGE